MIGSIQLHSPQSIWMASLVLVGGLATVLWLYRGQIRQVRSAAGWGLPALRGVALAALALSLFRPEILTPIQDEQRSIIAVLVDQSRSMSAVDSTRTDAELVQLAAALGALPEGVRSPEMSTLRNEISDLVRGVDEIERSRTEQRYAQLAGRGIESADAHLRDAQREFRSRVADLANGAPAALAEMVAQIDGEDPASRIAQGIARIDQLQQQADQELYRQDPRVRQICATLAASSRIQLVGRAMDGDEGLVSRLAAQRPVSVFGLSPMLSSLSAPFDRLEAEGAHGDFAAMVRALRGRLKNERLGAIVFFSDGRRVAGASEEVTFGSDLPVFTVAAAATLQRDLSIGRVWVPETVFAGQTIQVAVQLRAIGYETPEVQVTIESGGQRQSERVMIREEGAVVRLPFRIEHAGPQVLNVEVTPLPGEATVENNHVDRIVKVISDRIQVALLGGRATRDFEYFRDSLKSDPSIEAIDRLSGVESRLLSAEQIMEQDVVVLVELPQEALDARQWGALNRLVNQKGGSVIVATTDPAIAAGYASNSLAATLLPWRRGDALPSARVWPGAEAVFRIVPAAVNTTDTFRLWDESDPESPQWNDLPPVFRFLLLPPLRSSAQPLLVERDSNLPVLAEFPLGAGKVLFIGLDELWRWRGALVDDEADRLWLRLVHQAASPPYAVSGGGLALDMNEFRVEPGRPVRVRARAATGATLEVRRDDTVVMARVLTGAPGMTHMETTFSESPPGEYRVHLFTPDRSRQLSLPLHVEEDLEAEMRDVSGDEAELGRLAGVRGDVLTLADVNTLPQRLSRLKESDPVFAETRLWDSPYLFLFVVACLGLEWALRKRVGLI